MKRLDLIICFSLIVICLMTGSFCQEQFEEKPIFKDRLCGTERATVQAQTTQPLYYISSLFNIVKGLIIHTIRKGTVEVFFVNIPESIDTLHEKAVPKSLDVYKVNVKYGVLNDPKNPRIDKYKPMTAYKVPINRSSESCGDPVCDIIERSGLNLGINECDILCLHSSKDGTLDTSLTRIYSYNFSSRQLWPILHQELELALLERCWDTTKLPFRNMTNNCTRPQLLSFANWISFAPKDGIKWHNISLMTCQESRDKVKLVRLSKGQNETTIETWMNKELLSKDFYHIFGFNKYYKHMICEQNCTLDSILTWISFNPIHDQYSGLKYEEHTQTRLSLKNLLGCKPYYYEIPKYERNSLCNKGKKFLSIFNLGKDLYFQTMGRFYQSPNPSIRFKQYGNPYVNAIFGQNINNTRIESHFTDFLENQGFSSVEALTGFTYKSSNFKEVCPEGDLNCTERYYKSDYYLNACIYGFSHEGRDRRFRVRAYFYTQSGLTPYRNKDCLEENYKFCSFISEMPGAVYSSFRSKGSNYLNQLTMMFKSNFNSLHTYEWYPNQTMVLDPIPSKTYSVQNVKPMFVFALGDDLYSMNVLGDVYEYYPLSLPDIKKAFIKIDKNIQVLLTCPFAIRTSLVEFEREAICNVTQDKPNVAQSVFSIGWHHYHQKGQAFYYFDSLTQRFKYDRNLSDLLDTYFDTNTKMVSYSVETEPGVFQVLMYGKKYPQDSSITFKGDYIFALFQFDSKISQITVIDDKNDYQISEVNLTFGVFDITKDLSEPAVTALGLTYGTRMVLVGMREQGNNSLIIRYARRERKEMYSLFTDNSKDSFFKQIHSSNFSRYYHKILGFYNVEKEGILRMVAWSFYERNYSIFDTRHILGLDPTNGGNKFTNFQNIINYFEVYCLEKYGFQRSDSLSNPKILSKILAALIIILLLISLVSALYLSNLKTKEDNIGVKKRTVQTLKSNPSKSGSVGQQPEPNVDTSVSKEVKSTPKSNVS